MIPLNDITAENNSIKNEIDEAMQRVISKSHFIGGDEIKEFEKNFASYCEKKFCIGTSSGSSSLFVVLKCLGIKHGDEVIVPVQTFIATAASVVLCGAKPVFVDVNEYDSLINVSLIERSITEKTKAIIPVHLYGSVCDMDKIVEISEKHNLVIIEDCAQAHGSEYKGKIVPITDIGCFSFFPAKNLGAFGDAGAIVTSNKELEEKMRKYANHGRSEKYFHDQDGFNFRLDNLQAAILNVKLKYLDNLINKKREIAEKYDQIFSDINKIKHNSNVNHSYHLYVLRSKDRDKLRDYLKENGIESGIHYPIPLHLQPAFSNLGYKEGDFPIAEKLSKEIVSLPIYSELKEESIAHITSTVLNFFKNS